MFRCVPFAVPEYDRAFDDLFFDVVNDLARGRSGLLSAIPQAPPRRSGASSRIRDRQGLDVDMPVQSVEFGMSVDVEAVRSGDPAAFALAIDRASDDLAEQLVALVIKTMETVTTATGNVTSTSGKFDFEALYSALEQLEWSLTDDGELSLPSIVVHPDDAEALAKLPPPTGEQQQRMDALKARKLEELLARRRTRRLS